MYEPSPSKHLQTASGPVQHLQDREPVHIGLLLARGFSCSQLHAGETTGFTSRNVLRVGLDVSDFMIYLIKCQCEFECDLWNDYVISVNESCFYDYYFINKDVQGNTHDRWTRLPYGSPSSLLKLKGLMETFQLNRVLSTSFQHGSFHGSSKDEKDTRWRAYQATLYLIPIHV